MDDGAGRVWGGWNGITVRQGAASGPGATQRSRQTLRFDLAKEPSAEGGSDGCAAAWGGARDSGFGREHGEAAIENFTETKTVWIKYGSGLSGVARSRIKLTELADCAVDAVGAGYR
jgi:hypothetical protein